MHIKLRPRPPCISRRRVEGRTPDRHCLQVRPELRKSELRLAVVKSGDCQDRGRALAVGGESVDGDSEVGDDAHRSPFL